MSLKSTSHNSFTELIICYFCFLESLFSRFKTRYILIRSFFYFLSMDGQRVVIPLDPPANSKPGDRVFVEGFSHEQHGGIFFFLFLL